VLADVPAASLADDAPLYTRPMAPPADLEVRQSDDPERLPAPADCTDDLVAMLVDPSWVYRQYDHQLFLNTVVAPGGDAAVLRLGAPGLPASGKGLAVSVDSNPRWCAVDPRRGTELVVAESALNVACGGGKPVALVNCLNFGNPEHPEVMWQLSESVDGMAAACLALGIPVVGGNVSLYNESEGTDIDPTPVVAVLGVVEQLHRVPPSVALVDGAEVILIGRRSTGLSGSRWAVDRMGHRGGTLAPWDPQEHLRLLALVASLVNQPGLLAGVHDIADGGLAVALTEAALGGRGGIGDGPGWIGVTVEGIDGHGELFSEAPGRVLACTVDAAAVLAACGSAGIEARVVGRTGGDRVVVDGLVDLALADAAAAGHGALAGLLDA